MTSAITEKRLKNELKDLKKNKLEFAQAIQDETNKFIFYFLLAGDKEDPKNKEKTGHYEGGYYIGKIMLPPNYPEKPGDFMMLTPNGRFDVGKKICLTNSGYHTEAWTPIWSIRNMILGFASIFYVDLDTGISHIKMSKTERRKLAKESIEFNMKNFREIFLQFDQFVNESGKIKSTEEINQAINKPINQPINQQVNQVNQINIQTLPEVNPVEFKPVVPEIKPEIKPEPKPQQKLPIQNKKDDDFDDMVAQAIKISMEDEAKKNAQIIDAETKALEEAMKQIEAMEKKELETLLKNPTDEEVLKQLNDDITVYETIQSNDATQNNKQKQENMNVKNVKNKKSIKVDSKKNKKIDNKQKVNTDVSVLLGQQLDIMRAMTYKNFDMNIFNNVQKIIGLKQIE